MHHAAASADIDPDRVSFTRTLRLVRRQVTAQAALSPLTAGLGNGSSHPRNPAPPHHPPLPEQPPPDQTQNVQLETPTTAPSQSSPTRPHHHHRESHQTDPHQAKEARGDILNQRYCI